MNDNEIIKAVECCCVAEQQICRESKCPLFGNGNCFTELAINVRDLINRQKAEIEQLTQNLKFVRGTVERQKRENEILCQNADTAFQDGLNEAQDLYREQIKSEVKAEAIKEFAERLKEKVKVNNLGDGFVYAWEINNLVKEMVGADDA